ncbi:MAG: flavodoxin [Bacteroidetes bacterium HGW-Bacteroidetes-21]|jgi:flavorubredoxin|nr:MAG: flavodoxin [Bacteroidetes bacterium HGW-Bacteroidetes-21]
MSERVIVIYDSTFGNTKIIAETISGEFKTGTKPVHVSEISVEALSDFDIIIVGSPIIGWKPTEKTQLFLDSIKAGMLTGKKAATFDTRVKLFIHGDAAKKMAEKLKNAGAEIIIDPQPFYVKGKEGPLYDGEIDGVKSWVKKIIALL